MDPNRHRIGCVSCVRRPVLVPGQVCVAVVKAVETTDSCLQQVMECAKSEGYAVVVIADHGNADLARNEDGSPHTAHTTNPVPVWVHAAHVEKVKDGILADVAPTVLALMELAQPEEMTGRPLV